GGRGHRAHELAMVGRPDRSLGELGEELELGPPVALASDDLRREVGPLLHGRGQPDAHDGLGELAGHDLQERLVEGLDPSVEAEHQHPERLGTHLERRGEEPLARPVRVPDLRVALDRVRAGRAPNRPSLAHSDGSRQLGVAVDASEAGGWLDPQGRVVAAAGRWWWPTSSSAPPGSIWSHKARDGAPVGASSESMATAMTWSSDVAAASSVASTPSRFSRSSSHTTPSGRERPATSGT